MKKVFLSSIAILINFGLYSQIQEEWNVTYSISPGVVAANYEVIVGSDGMIYSGGYCFDSISPTYYLMKCKPSGATVWIKNFPSLGPFSYGISINCPIGLALDSKQDIAFVTSEYDANDPNKILLDFRIHKFDSAGNLIWDYTYGGGDSIQQSYKDLTFDIHDNLIVLLTVDTLKNPFKSAKVAGVYSIDPAGATNWIYSNDDGVNYSDFAGEVISDSTGKIYCSAYDGQQVTDSGSFLLIVLDSNGNILQEVLYKVGNTWGSAMPPTIAIDGKGNSYLSGFGLKNIGNTTEHRSYSVKIDSMGSIQWSNFVVLDTGNGGFIGVPTSNRIDGLGNLHVAQAANSFNAGNEFYHLILDSNGNVVGNFVSNIGSYISDWHLPYDLYFDSTFNLFVTGYAEILPQGWPNLSIYTAMLDSNLNLIWYALFDEGIGVGTSQSLAYSNGAVYIAGYGDSKTPGLNPGYLIKYCTDCFAHIQGDVWHDPDTNCISDSLESAQIGWLVEASPGPYYATTDPFGHYNLILPPGNFTVNEILKPGWGTHCPASGTHTGIVPNKGDVDLYNDFGNKIADTCAHLWVDIGTAVLRRCGKPVYKVNYCNNGTAPIDSVYIVVSFDSTVVPDSASVPWTSQTAYSYTWFIDTLLPAQCGSFKIYVSVSCDIGALNTSHCIEARIYPDSACTNPADSDWDKSSVKATSYCESDSLACFIIKNTGSSVNGNMQGTSDYRIYENNVLVYSGKFQLAGGDSIIICWPAQGNTIRLEADQRPGHPGKSKPNDEIELCGNPNQVKGAINNLPQDDLDDFKSIDCKMVLAPSDPNEKLVSPAGLIGDKFVAAATTLTYQINFQNTGTDTAFKVIVKDTLPAELDVKTAKSGAASHPNQFSISGPGILQWTFYNIKLVDSTTNEPASHGFVKFTVNPDTGLPEGTKIENRAGIYFDYEDVVMTAFALSTISDTVLISLNEAPKFSNPGGLFIYPNPADGSFWLDGNFELPAIVDIRDIYGRILFHKKCNIRPIQILIPEFAKGIYLVEMKDEMGNGYSGRVVVE